MSAERYQNCPQIDWYENLRDKIAYGSHSEPVSGEQTQATDRVLRHSTVPRFRKFDRGFQFGPIQVRLFKNSFAAGPLKAFGDARFVIRGEDIKFLPQPSQTLCLVNERVLPPELTIDFAKHC